MKSNMKKTTKNSSAAKAPAKKTTSPAKKKPAVSKEPPATFISAKIDIGFGNHLYIRGEGPGLSWDHGVAMDCVGSDLWTISITKAVTPITFKLLVNDLSWNTGEDYVVQPGQSLTTAPSF